jgi:hypothetical protein
VKALSSSPSTVKKKKKYIYIYIYISNGFALIVGLGLILSNLFLIRYWSLNSELYTYKLDAVPLELLLQPVFSLYLYIFKLSKIYALFFFQLFYFFTFLFAYISRTGGSLWHFHT